MNTSIFIAALALTVAGCRSPQPERESPHPVSHVGSYKYHDEDGERILVLSKDRSYSWTGFSTLISSRVTGGPAPSKDSGTWKEEEEGIVLRNEKGVEKMLSMKSVSGRLSLELDGVWFKFESEPNSEGSVSP